MELQGLHGESQSVRDMKDRDAVSSQAIAALPGSLAEDSGSLMPNS